MPIYRYNVTRQGLSTVEIVTADDTAQARTKLRREKIDFSQLELVKQTRIGDAEHIGARSPSEQKITSLTTRIGARMLALRQISSLISAGVPILTAINTAGSQAPKGLKRALFAISERIENGQPLAKSFRQEAPFFGRVTLGLLEVGEANGTLQEMTSFAASLLERTAKIRGQIIQAMIYPCIVMVVATGVVTFLFTRVIPKLIDFLGDRGAALPTITQALVDVTAFLQIWGIYILLSPLLISISIYFARKTPSTGDQIDKQLLRIPLIGTIVLAGTNSIWCRTLGILMQSGVNVVSALELTQSAIGNLHIHNQFTIIRKVVETGQPLTMGFNLTTIAQRAKLEIAMLATGESAGQIDEGLLSAATFSEELLENKLSLMVKMIEPIMYIVIGGIVGFVYIALFVGLVAASTGGAGH